jgi:hypothetical protein
MRAMLLAIGATGFASRLVDITDPLPRFDNAR